MTRALAFAFLLAACSPPGGDPGPDGAPGDDARDPTGDASGDGGQLADGGPGDPDAAPGQLPAGAACDPLLEECSPGLTCGMTAQPTGWCRIAGDLSPGDPCPGGDETCGRSQVCVSHGGTLGFRCRVICDENDPAPRCSEGTCWALWGRTDGIGWCDGGDL